MGSIRLISLTAALIKPTKYDDYSEKWDDYTQYQQEVKDLWHI